MAGERDLEWICRLLGLSDVSQIASREEIDPSKLGDTLKLMGANKWNKDYLVFSARGLLHMYGWGGHVDVPIDGLALTPGVKMHHYDIDFVKGMALLAGSLDQRLTLATHVFHADLIAGSNQISLYGGGINNSGTTITLEPLMIRSDGPTYPLIEAYTVRK